MGLLQRLAAPALILWIALYVPLVLSFVGAMGYAAYWLTAAVFGILQRTGSGTVIGLRLVLWLPILVVAFDLAVLSFIFLFLRSVLGIFRRTVSEPAIGYPLPRDQHKTLHDLIDRICKRLSARPPDGVFLSPFDETCITDYSVVWNGVTVKSRARSLVIGAAHVVHLRADELAAIICHEIAHASMGDTRIGPTASRFFRAAGMALSDLLDDPGLLDLILSLPLRAYYFVLAVLFSADSRRRELRADRMSAMICGRQTTRNALMKTHLPDYLPDLTIRALFAEFIRKEGAMANLYQEHRERWNQLPPARLEQAKSRMFLQQGSIWSSHPPFAERMRNVTQLSARELVIDKPATRLFHRWADIEKELTEALISVGRELYEEHMRRMDLELRTPAEYRR